MPTQKIDPKVIFASDAPAIDKPPVFSDKTKGWDVARANDGRPQIKEMNKVQQDTDLKILWLNENSITPYDASIDYPDGAVAIKDGSFKQLSSGSWVEFLDGFADKDAVKRGIANRYDSSLTYNSGERVVLTNGDIVKSTIDGNANDPNVDMVGWVKVSNTFEVSSIQEMLDIPYPIEGMRAFNSGTQAGEFVYRASLPLFNNGITVFNKWVRVWDSLNIQPEWAGAVEGQDSTVALQKILDFISPTAFDTSVAVMNLKKGGLTLEIPATKLGYTITDTLWVGAGTRIVGSGKMSFMTPSDTVCSKLIANLSDPLKPLMSTSNWKTGGVRVAYDEKTYGAMYDGGLISHTPDIKLTGFNLFVAEGTRAFMGLRIQNSPLSEVKIACHGFDYGIMMNACWESEVDSFTLSHKCGFLAEFDNNNCTFNGYYNSNRTIEPLVASNLIDFFTPDTDTDNTLNNADKTFGFVSRYGYGSVSTALTCEGSHVNSAICNGGFVAGSLYTEGAANYGLVSFASQLDIGLHAGAFDQAVYCFGSNGKMNLEAYTKDGTPPQDIFKKVSQYGTVIKVPETLNAYTKGIIYKQNGDTIYVGSSGSDLNCGVINNQELLTLDEAFKRITDKSLYSDHTISNGSKKTNIVIVSSGNFTLDGVYLINESVSIKSLSSLATKPVLKINGRVVLVDADINIVDCDVEKSNVAGDIENACFWTRYGRNTVSINSGTTSILNGGLVYCDYAGSSELTLLLNNVSVTGGATSQLVQGNYLNESPHIVNVVRSRGSISAAITSRADKGVSVPAAWQNKILGL